MTSYFSCELSMMRDTRSYVVEHTVSRAEPLDHGHTAISSGKKMKHTRFTTAGRFVEDLWHNQFNEFRFNESTTRKQVGDFVGI